MLYVSADHYASLKEKWDGTGIETDMYPVDLNYAYVALDVDEASKNSDTDMNSSAECNRTRFGLNKV